MNVWVVLEIEYRENHFRIPDIVAICESEEKAQLAKQVAEMVVKGSPNGTEFEIEEWTVM